MRLTDRLGSRLDGRYYTGGAFNMTIDTKTYDPSPDLDLALPFILILDDDGASEDAQLEELMKPGVEGAFGRFTAYQEWRYRTGRLS